MKNISLITLLLLVACGKAPQSNADRQILNHERPEPLTTLVKLKSEPREIIIFAFPDQSEVKDYYYDESKRFASEEDFETLFSMIPYGNNYTFNITKDMTPAQKVQGIMGKVIAIADARDKSRRETFEPRKKVLELARKTQESIKDFPCYEVTKRGNKNRGKCYLKPIPGITKDTPKERIEMETCNDIEAVSKNYLTVSPDSGIPANTETEYFLSADKLPDLESDLATCEEQAEIVEKYENIAAVGKLEVAMLVGSGEIPGKDKLLFRAKSELDRDIDGGSDLESTIVFNTKTLTFEKFSIAINFYDGSEPVLYGPEHGNMEMPVVTEINGSGYYRVDFEIKAPKFTLKTLGLSLEVDPIFGLRVSGKTMLHYADGRTRPGIMRIDVSPKE